MQTLAGNLTTNRYVFLSELTLPEFDKSKKISGNTALVFDSDCNYDIILGRDLLQKIGLVLNFGTNTIEWLDAVIPMKTPDFWTSPNSFYSAMDDTDDDIFPGDHFESFKAQALKKLLASDYKAVSINDVIASQHHLSTQ